MTERLADPGPAAGFTPARTGQYIGTTVQYFYRFANGRGASVIPELIGINPMRPTPNRWEMAVLDGEGNLDYATPVTDDVLRYLTPSELTAALAAIAVLPREGEDQ